jgi:hypothetical protein
LLFPAALQQVACKYRADTGERRVAMRNRVQRNNAEQYETLKTLEIWSDFLIFVRVRFTPYRWRAKTEPWESRAKAQSASFNFLNALICAAASSSAA